MSDCYKIKRRQAGYRLVYRVDDDVVFVTVIGVDKRNQRYFNRISAARACPCKPSP
jgi:mRNA interferase RelE/StbE